MEAKPGLSGGIQPGVMPPSGFQQGEGADHVGLDEIGRRIDRSVDMTFRRQMHDRVGVVGLEHLPHRRRVRDVGANQQMAVVAAPVLERLLGRSVCHLVDIDHDVVSAAEQKAHHGGANETATAGQQKLHRPAHPPCTMRLPYHQFVQRSNLKLHRRRINMPIEQAGEPGGRPVPAGPLIGVGRSKSHTSPRGRQPDRNSRTAASPHASI